MKLFLSVVFLGLLANLITPAMALAQNLEKQHTAHAKGSQTEKPAMAHHRVAKPILVPFDDSTSAVLWKPDLSTVPLTIKEGKIELPKTGVDNYHVIVAEQQLGNLKKVFIHYIFRHGKPSGHSTSEVVTANKAELEIIPDPVPREHDRYYSQQEWSFIVHFHNEPLASHSVQLNTENGSHLEGMTNNQGRVTFKLPDDFQDVIAGSRDKRTAHMTIQTQYQSGNKQWQTQLGADYAVSESNWRSTPWGIAIMIFGLILGGLFIRLNKGKTGNHK